MKKEVSVLHTNTLISGNRICDYIVRHDFYYNPTANIKFVSMRFILDQEDKKRDVTDELMLDEVYYLASANEVILYKSDYRYFTISNEPVHYVYNTNELKRIMCNHKSFHATVIQLLLNEGFRYDDIVLPCFWGDLFIGIRKYDEAPRKALDKV